MLPEPAAITIGTSQVVPLPAERDPARAAVAFDGTVAVALQGYPAIALYAPDLRLMREFGFYGEGPGELPTAVGYLGFRGNVPVVSAEARVVSAAPAGHSWKLQTWSTPPGIQLLSSMADSSDFWQPNPGAGLPVRRIGTGSQTGRELISVSDSFYARITTARDGSGEPRWPVYSSTEQTLVVADGYNYTAMAVDLSTGSRVYFGRTLSPRLRTAAELEVARAAFGKGIIGPSGQRIVSPALAARLARLGTDTLPHFKPGGLVISGRMIFVLGQSNDSGFIDVFIDHVFAQRVAIPCRRAESPSLAWPWLVVTCGIAEDPEGREVEIRRFKLESATP